MSDPTYKVYGTLTIYIYHSVRTHTDGRKAKKSQLLSVRGITKEVAEYRLAEWRKLNEKLRDCSTISATWQAEVEFVY